MKLVILLVFVAVAAVSAVPLGPGDIHQEEVGNAVYEEMIPLYRVRR